MNFAEKLSSNKCKNFNLLDDLFQYMSWVFFGFSGVSIFNILNLKSFKIHDSGFLESYFWGNTCPAQMGH